MVASRKRRSCHSMYNIITTILSRKKPVSMVTFWITFLYLVLFMGHDRVWRSLERLKLRIFLSRLLLFEKRSENYFLSIIQSIGARVYIHFEALFSWKSNKVRSVEYLHGYQSKRDITSYLQDDIVLLTLWIILIHSPLTFLLFLLLLLMWPNQTIGKSLHRQRW